MHGLEQISEWLDRILGSEGGYTDDPADPGNWTGGKVGQGELKGTKFGISAAAYPNLYIADLEIGDAANIFRDDYLRPIGADRFRDGVAFQLFDLAVNSGPGRAIKLLQKALGTTPDGIVGPVTIGALKALSESDIIMLAIAERIDFMRSLKNWPDHGKGWMGRIADNLRYGAADS